MNMFSWKYPLIVLCTVGMFGACSSSDKKSNPPPVEASTCGNGTIESGEDCDGTKLGGATCASATTNAKPNGNLGCTSACKFDTTGCTGSTGGTTGSGGTTGAGGGVGTGGTTGDASADSSADSSATGGSTGTGGSGTGGAATGGTTSEAGTG